VQRPKVFEVEGSDKSPLKSSFGIMDVNDFTLLAQYTVFSLKTLGFSPCSLNSNRGEHLIRISYGWNSYRNMNFQSEDNDWKGHDLQHEGRENKDSPISLLQNKEGEP